MPTSAAQIVDLAGLSALSWEAAKAIIDYQSTLIYFCLGFVGLVFPAITVIWWIVNSRRVSVKLKEVVRSAKSKAKDTIDAAVSEFDDRMGAELSARNKEFAGLKEMMVEQGAVNDLETARLLAVTCFNQKWFEAGAFWWLETIVRGVKLRKVAKNIEFKEAILKTATERTLQCLNSSDNLDVLSDKEVKEMRESVKKIPPLLEQEKQQIKSKITELTKKTPSSSRKDNIT